MRRYVALLPVLSIALLAACVVLAILVATIWIGFQDGVPGASRYTLANFQEMATDRFGYAALLNTVLYTVFTTLLTMVMAAPMAWLVARTRFPLKQPITLLLALVLVIPGFVQGIGWSLLLSPSIGIINRFFKDFTGSADPLFDIATLPGMIVVQSLNLVPPAFFILVPALSLMDASLEEAAYISGVSKPRAFLRVNMPLALPAILASGIYVMVLAFSLFEIPAVLGLPHRIFVFSTMIYILINTSSGLPAYGLAAVYGTILMTISIVLTMLYGRIFRESRRYVTITGKGRRAGLLNLGRWQPVAVVAVCLYLFLALGLPFVTLIWVSLLPFLQVPSAEALSSVSLQNYTGILAKVGLEPFINTLVLVITVPVIVVLVALPISWTVVRSRVPGHLVLDAIAFLPTAVPRVVLAVSFIYLGLLLRPILPAYGTVTIIVAAHFVMFLSFATRSLNGALVQIHPDLEEAGRLCGASVTRVIARVTTPLLRPALYFSWLWVMLLSFREVTVALMLTSTRNIVLPVLIWNRWTDGRAQESAAVAVLLTGIAVLLLLGLRRGLQRMSGQGV